MRQRAAVRRNRKTRELQEAVARGVAPIENFDVIAFRREWASAWNRRDVETVLEHFDDDALFTSPVARKIGFAEDRVVRGKDALRRYWQSAFDNNPGPTGEDGPRPFY
jgi:ketosteroid isomerase-like protein